jgi:hypothetical protein
MRVQQRVDHLDIRLIGRRRRYRMRSPQIGIHPDVCLHPDVPLVALLRLVHLRIAFACRVLRRDGRGDGRRVHDAPALERESLAREVRIHPPQDLRRQFAFLQQASEIEDRRLVRNRFGVSIRQQWLLCCAAAQVSGGGAGAGCMRASTSP